MLSEECKRSGCVAFTVSGWCAFFIEQCLFHTLYNLREKLALAPDWLGVVSSGAYFPSGLTASTHSGSEQGGYAQCLVFCYIIILPRQADECGCGSRGNLTWLFLFPWPSPDFTPICAYSNSLFTKFLVYSWFSSLSHERVCIRSWWFYALLSDVVRLFVSVSC